MTAFQMVDNSIKPTIVVEKVRNGELRAKCKQQERKERLCFERKRRRDGESAGIRRVRTIGCNLIKRYLVHIIV
jgi:hypothetical protein